MADFEFGDGIESGAPGVVIEEAIRLQCINRMLESIGEYPVSSLSTLNPDFVQADQILTRVNRQIQAERWHFNHRRHVVLALPTDTLAVSGGVGEYIFDEVVVETISGATGTFKYILNGVMFIVKDATSADFVGGDAIVGQTSAANRDTAAHEAITVARHATDVLWLRVDSTRQHSFIDVAQVGQHLFNKDENTFDFTFELVVDFVLLVPLEDTPIALVDYVCAQAAREFQQAARNGQVSDGFTGEDVFKKRVIALHADAENEDDNILRERWALQILGDRRRDVLDHLSR